MRRLALVLFALTWPLLLLGETCGTDIGDKQRGEPCTRSSECAEGLVCTAGICDDPPGDGGVDGGS